MKKDVMIDFETLGNGDSKCLCQVGAVYFDSVTGEIGGEFKANIDARTHVKRGAKIDADTVYWWLKQSDAARASILAEGRDVLEVMQELNQFLDGAARIWSHATFDFVTLTDTLKQLSIKPTFSYKAGMDIRTLIYLAGTQVSSMPREGIHHDALEDCKHQVKYCVEALQVVKNNKKLLKFINGLNNG